MAAHPTPVKTSPPKPPRQTRRKGRVIKKKGK